MLRVYSIYHEITRKYNNFIFFDVVRINSNYYIIEKGTLAIQYVIMITKKNESF